MKQGWIAVDLDNTLAEYDHWRGPGHIGLPIAPMVQRVRAWLREGREVRLFTARWSCLEQRDEFSKAWAAWSQEHLGAVLVVTCEKDYSCAELWDDRAVRVVDGWPCCSGRGR